MYSILYMVGVEIVNSKVTFNREYTRPKKILIFLLINVCILGYMLYNYQETKSKNLYELFKLQRKAYAVEDVQKVVGIIATDVQYGTISSEEFNMFREKAQSLVDPVRNRFYEVVGDVFVKPSDKEDEDVDVVKQMKTQALSKATMFYLISFSLFCIIFASAQTAVIKSVCLISFIFWYFEIELGFNPRLEENLESIFPFLVSFTTFEKIEILRIFFQFSVQNAVGFARVLVDAERKFANEDKIGYFKIMSEHVKAVSHTILSWKPVDKPHKEMKKLQKEAEDQKIKKKGWGRYIMWIILAYVLYSNVKPYLTSESNPFDDEHEQ